jgi:hypothetical protein
VLAGRMRLTGRAGRIRAHAACAIADPIYTIERSIVCQRELYARGQLSRSVKKDIACTCFASFRVRAAPIKCQVAGWDDLILISRSRRVCFSF